MTMDMDAKTLLRTSIEWGHAHGWTFTPLAGKRPVDNAWAAAGRETLEQALAWAAAGNVGLRTGTASGVVVIDLDTGKPGFKMDRVAALGLPPTVNVMTGSGGWHLYFAMPAGVEVKNSAARQFKDGRHKFKLAPFVDVRATGGQVVFPGSIHPDTDNPYVWRPQRAPWEIALAELPADIIKRLNAPGYILHPDGREETLTVHEADSPEAGDNPQRTPTPPAANDLEERRRRHYVMAAIDAELAELKGVTSGRNDALNVCAFKLGGLVGGGLVQYETVFAAMLAVIPPQFQAANVGTIHSGLRAGMKEPRRMPESQPRRMPESQPRPAPRPTPPATPEDTAGRVGGPELDADGLVKLGTIDPRSGRLVLSGRRTLPTAEAYIREFATHGPTGLRTIHCYAGNLMAWAGNRYAIIEDGALRHALQPWLHDALQYDSDGELEPFAANPASVTAAVDTIRARVHVASSREMPFWVSGAADIDPREILPCRTINLHIPSRVVMSATPDLFTPAALEFDYDAAAPRPVEWEKFLAALWPDDPQAISLLQEWFGYCLTSDTSQQKMLLAVGPKRCGKGTLGRVLGELIGRGNVAGPTTESLGSQFGLSNLIGKSLAIVSDARFAGANLQTTVERLLCISGEDTLTIDRKFLDPVTIKLPTRMMFLTNELPSLRDTAGALAGRFLILTLTNSFYGKEDTGLIRRLLAELPGILRWALVGWERLHARGKFEQPASSRDSIEMLDDLSSPLLAFIRERCTIGPTYRVVVQELFTAWRAWCEESGRDNPGTVQRFGQMMRAAVPDIAAVKPNNALRYYKGLCLNEAVNAASGTLPLDEQDAQNAEAAE